MPRNSSLQLQQEADIKAAYQKLKQQKKYTTEYILEKLSKKFFLMPWGRTIVGTENNAKPF